MQYLTWPLRSAPEERVPPAQGYQMWNMMLLYLSLSVDASRKLRRLK